MFNTCKEEQKQYLKAMTENFSKLMSDSNPQIQRVQRTWSIKCKNKPKSTSRHILDFKEKIKKKILKEDKWEKKKTLHPQESRTLSPILLKNYTRGYSETFKVLKKKNVSLEFFTLWNYPSKMEKGFLKQKLRESAASRYVFQDILKDVLQRVRRMIYQKHQST